MTQRENIFVLHVSDLHVGRNATATGHIKLGANEHDFELAKALTRSMGLLRLDADRKSADLNLVVSGDLTATGAPGEFFNVQTFLGSRWLTCTRRPSVAGLAQPRGRFEAVPGNHDHWGGGYWGRRDPRMVLPPANNPPADQFRETPWVETWSSRAGGLELELFGMDSNAGLRSRNPRAVGRLDAGECRRLVELMNASTPTGPGVDRVRALMIHHSPSHDGLTATMDRQSRQLLVSMCIQHRISAVLCGHVHLEAAVPLNAAKTAYELRSPATLTGSTDRTDPGFLVHQISSEPGDGIRWTTFLHRWGKNNRFMPMGRFNSFMC